jgi:DNA repair protein RadA/Sms
VSSHLGVVIPHDVVFFGEISLSGTVRAVGQTDARLKEAQKLGFRRAFVPPGATPPKGIVTTPIPSVAALIEQLKTFH